MIRPNWDIFKAKFSENPQGNFEWLCYLLFCKEYNQEKGIFRFKNQSGIETDPIRKENDYIAWEAKFYTTEEKLSDNVVELKKKIDIAKCKNPEITKLVFYTPIDWTESTKKTERKTQKQIEIEEYANDKTIVIDSAEKLLYLNNTDPFKEFLTILINNNWKIIFTTRDHYLEVLNIFSLQYVLTKPKGQGWRSLIKFVFNKIDDIGIKNINFILPVIHDWNSKVKEGETTRYSSLIALHYYQYITAEELYYFQDDTKEHLLQTILYGSSEIQEELKNIFEEILQNNWKKHRDPYFDLSKVVLTKIEGIPISRVLPNYVLKLADLFWTYTAAEEGDRYYHSHRDIEEYFGLEPNHSEYYSASAYQTPIYWLLQFKLKDTIDFILKFINKSVKTYATSGFDDSVQKIKVFINNEKVQYQYISHCLWSMYRGTVSPVSPYLLQSIHMALEKFFLENGKNSKFKSLEGWLLYLLKYSESASITSVVTSIVLAYPEKTFNVAKVLFKSKELIISDNARLVLDQGAKSLYSIGQNMGSINNEFYDNERIKTCEDKHRKWTLENLLLQYQCFKNEDTSESEAENRQKIIWGILDTYYEKLPMESEQTESDKMWRLFLARMDRRKMDITTEKTDKGIAIQFNPKLDPDIKEYSEKSLEKSSEPMKYTSLKMWSELKFRNDQRYKGYEIYEKNPLLALKEVKDILKKLKRINAPEKFKIEPSEEESFYLLNYSIPTYVCSILIENNFDKLSKKNKLFCRDIILEVAALSLQPNYMYQVRDGVQPAIYSLATLLKAFPKDKEKIKLILLFALFKDQSVGGFVSTERFNIFPIKSIHKLWEKKFDDAHSLLLGYLLLKPKYDALIRQIREENFRNGNFNSHNNPLLERFIAENENVLQDMINNELSLSDLGNIEEYDLSILLSAFKMIPQKTDNNDHSVIANRIFSYFAKKLLHKDRNDKIDHHVKYSFFRTYAFFVLNSKKAEIQSYLKPFLDNFTISESIAELFQEFILAEDVMNTYENFWIVWNTFKSKVIENCKNEDGYWSNDKILKSYLFAQVPWKETTKEWHSLKEKDKYFFKEISEKLGNCSSVLYAISKLLNDIGSPYLDDGIVWIEKILSTNHDYVSKELPPNTIYYIENTVRKFILKNREKVKKTNEIKNKLITILNFLIEKGSVIGYMLRESII